MSAVMGNGMPEEPVTNRSGTSAKRYLFLHPLSVCASSVMDKLDRNCSNNFIGSPFVMMSANWCSVGNVENSQLSNGHLLSDEMYVKLDVFGPAMMNRILCEVDGGDVVAVHDRGLLDVNM